MKNLFFYLQYYGNVSFKEMAFNDVDSLICSLLSYVKLLGIVPNSKNEFIYLEDACEQFLAKYDKSDFKKEDWLFPNSYKLIEMLKDAKRFWHTKLSYYVASVDGNGQFGALLLRLPNRVTYLSFEGTDSNVSGWKEDFQIIYENPTYSQEKAVMYFNNALKLGDTSIYLGGHSKGGNLAMYAYLYGKDKYKRRVRKVYNFDGPGFVEEITKSEKYQELLNKLAVFVPRESVIGMILENANLHVVKSNSLAVLQHDAYTWECFGGKFVLTELAKKSKNLHNNLEEYLKSMSLEDRKNFVETFFDIFKKSEITNIMQLKELKIASLLKIMKELKNVPTKTKQNLIAILRLLITGMN